MKKVKKAEIATFLTLGLVIVGAVVTLATSFLINQQKNIASNPRASSSNCPKPIPSPDKACCFCQNGKVRVYASSKARRNNCMATPCTSNYYNNAYGAQNWGYCNDDGTGYEEVCKPVTTKGEETTPAPTPPTSEAEGDIKTSVESKATGEGDVKLKETIAIPQEQITITIIPTPPRKYCNEHCSSSSLSSSSSSTFSYSYYYEICIPNSNCTYYDSNSQVIENLDSYCRCTNTNNINILENDQFFVCQQANDGNLGIICCSSEDNNIGQGENENECFQGSLLIPSQL